jgi:hypothetical protein
MNWRTITGLILLIVGIRVFYMALHAAGDSGTKSMIGSFIWIGVGTFLVIKGMTKKVE